MAMEEGATLEQLLKQRKQVTEQLEQSPYHVLHYLKRCNVYANLGFPDLAAMDAYKALLLVDEVLDESGEYHEQAFSSLTSPLETPSSEDYELSFPAFANQALAQLSQLTMGTQGDIVTVLAEQCGLQARINLIHNLITVGCLRSAYDFLQQLHRQTFTPETVSVEEERLYSAANKHFQTRKENFDQEDFDPEDLPDRGFVRREIYPWNEHEQDRNSAKALQLLNDEMRMVSSKLEVKVTELPILSNDTNGNATQATIRQLGVFAKKDIAAGEEVLRERSLLTANSHTHDPLCDACSAELSDFSTAMNTSNDESGSVPCEDCGDIVFCSQTCHDLAQESYHAAVCGTDVESIAKEVPASEAADALYTLLLLRALALAQNQEMHPLDLKEVKYIWGDFTTPPSFKVNPHKTGLENGEAHFLQCQRTLPFSFSANILLPLHMLEKMDLDIFEPLSSSGQESLELSETWVINTLYAKIRGTASGRVNPRDGRPEVAAVHPLWCLANHSCDPNVQWEWAGEIKFNCREKRLAWKRKHVNGAEEEGEPQRPGGIRKGEEILNHYVDIDLPVKERREWGAGALGGSCMCKRCIWEAGG